MTILRQRLLWLIILLTALVGRVHASAPAILTYQGRLKEAGSPVTGSRSIGIYFCNAAAGGTCIPGGNQGDQTVSVVNGVFRSTYTVPGWDPTTGQWFLEARVADVPLTPREQLTSSPYSIYAASATTLVADGGAGVTISTPIFIAGTAQPAVSAAGQGSLYFDSTAKRFEISENAGAYTPLGGWYRLAQGASNGAAASYTLNLPAGAQPRNLKIRVYIPGKSAADRALLQFNGDTAADYAGGGVANGFNLEVSNGPNAGSMYSTIEVLNVNGAEKLASFSTVSQNAAGTGTLPVLTQQASKWTGAAVINSITVTTIGGASTLNAGTEVVVYAGD